MTTYEDWIAARGATHRFTSAPVVNVTDRAFPHQRALIEWALRKGRAALFADTGLGKTVMQLEWARNVATEGRVLVVAPLAVCEQTVAEGAEFGIECAYRRSDEGDAITVTNYEMVEQFDPGEFVGVALDESSILKSFTGKTRNTLIASFADTPYRLACTATPAPNDFTELGNHSEFLGVKTRTEMLAEYFVHDGGSTQDWRLKGHAVADFWRWVASWGAVVRTPEDIGFPDDRYKLPPVRMVEHVVPVDHSSAWGAGALFADQAQTLSDQRRVRRESMSDRVARAARIVAEVDGPVVVWCELNAESAAVSAAIPGSVEVKGADSPEDKARRLNGFARGEFGVLVTKTKIAGFGMNWQHCADMVFMGASHSYEQTYQAIRRCWRFGQKRRVTVNVIRSEADQGIVANYRRKEAAAARMAQAMSEHAAAVLREDLGTASAREWNDYSPAVPMDVPAWVGRDER